MIYRYTKFTMLCNGKPLTLTPEYSFDPIKYLWQTGG
jgi:hypothetical protein